MKKNKTKYIIIFAIVILVGTIVLLFTKGSSSSITKVKKLLGANNYDIHCIDKDCSYVVSYSGDKSKKSSVKIFNSYGKKVASFNTSNTKTNKVIYQATDNYFIYKNYDDKKIVGYAIANKKGKEQYSTKNTLSTLTNNLILMTEGKDKNVYTILDAKGNNIFTNVEDYKKFDDLNLLYVKSNTEDIIIFGNNSKIFGYTVAEEIKDDNNQTKYLILEDSNKNSFRYYNVKKNEFFGDSFQNYSKKSNGKVIVTKRENNRVNKYLLKDDGTQEKIGDGSSQSELLENIKKKIDSKRFYIYTTSVIDSNQKYILVDDVKDNKFGFYDIKKNKFIEIYSYKESSNANYSTIYNLSESDDEYYFQVNCTKDHCDNTIVTVVELTNKEKLYVSDSDELVIQKYTQFEGGYKTIRYSSQTKNVDFKNMYALYDKDNKLITKSKNPIVVVDKKKTFGYEISLSSIIYSAKENKVLNTDDSLASIIDINNKKYYNYTSKDKNILVDEKGKKVLSLSSSSKLIYSSESIIYNDDNTINILNTKNNKIKKYKLKKNEKINDASGKTIAPYRNTLFINNSVDDNAKVVSINGKVLKNIKKQEIDSVVQSKVSNNVFIITKKSKKNDEFGLYIAK